MADNKIMFEDVHYEVLGHAKPLVEGRWRNYMEGIVKAKPDIDPWVLGQTALCLENVRKFYKKNMGIDYDLITETTNTGAIADFIRHGFDIIAAVMPSLIANEILSVQTLTRRKGEIFFMEYLYGTTKGRIQAGQEMFSADVAGNAEIWYSHETVPEEPVVQNGGVAGAGPFAGNLLAFPLRPTTVKVTMAKDGGGTLTATDDGAGNLTGTDVAAGTIDTATGAISVTWNADAAANAWMLATYRVNFETNPEFIPEVEIAINTKSVEALDRKLRALYTLDFSYDIQEEFGMNPESLLGTGLASETRQEIDGELLQFVFDSAAAPAPTDWNTIAPTGVSYTDHKFTFIDTLLEANNNIFGATRRATGNFVVAGLKVCNVIESLAPRFQRQGRMQPGPHFIGTLDNTWKIYKNPYYATTKYTVGFKGEQWVEAGAVYSPYMPVFMTRPIMLDDFKNRRGMATSYAKSLVNGLFYTNGQIVSVP